MYIAETTMVLDLFAGDVYERMKILFFAQQPRNFMMNLKIVI